MTPEHFRAHLDRLIRTAATASRAGDLALVRRSLDDPEWEPAAFDLVVFVRVFRLNAILRAIDLHRCDTLEELLRVAPLVLNAREHGEAAELLAMVRRTDDDPGDAWPAPRRLQ